MAWYGDEADFQSFVDEFGLTFPQVSDPDGVIFADYGVASQPAFAVISPDGAIQVERGAVDNATIDAMIEAASA